MAYKKLSLEKKIVLWFFFVLFLVILVLTALTPMLADDYSYSFSFADRSRITSLSGILSSLQAHRDSMNGRMTAHFFAHLFLLLPKPVFCVLNALVFCLIVFSLFRIVRGRDERMNIFLLLLIFFLIWLYTPVFGQVFLWLDGACNYSWALCSILAYLYPYIAAYLRGGPLAPGSVWKKALFLLLAFLAGSYSEGASFAAVFIAFAFLLCLWHRDQKLPRFLLAALAAACLGYLFLMTAPLSGAAAPAASRPSSSPRTSSASSPRPRRPCCPFSCYMRRSWPPVSCSRPAGNLLSPLPFFFWVPGFRWCFLLLLCIFPGALC